MRAAMMPKVTQQREITMSEGKAKVVRGTGAAARAEQGSIYSAGVSAETVGAAGLWLGVVSLPAGARTTVHLHEAHETGLYMMSGTEVELFTGADLDHREVVRPGDYLFIPGGLPHVAVNRSDAAAVFMGARTDPNANESVVLLPELDARFVGMEESGVRGERDGHH
jgi:uncharacterized RmlC-like cupin family protein